MEHLLPVWQDSAIPVFPTEPSLFAVLPAQSHFTPRAAGLVAFSLPRRNLGSGSCGKGARALQLSSRPEAARPPARGDASLGAVGPRAARGATAVDVAPGDCAPAGPTGRRGREEGRRGAGRAGRDGGGAVAPAAAAGALRAEQVPLRGLRASARGALGAVGEPSPEPRRGGGPRATAAAAPSGHTVQPREPAAPAAAADGVHLSWEAAGEAGTRQRERGAGADPNRSARPPAREL